ncbi:MAG TPA: RHS repeat-associated core domain-containing protein [Candidatus Polarisedimenticolia bacterium]|jgi:RHS repeat-associated protein|nr:RHS repeat-associated core domain-containing protein [Candidatus Polarisedimenticolia bacterium]
MIRRLVCLALAGILASASAGAVHRREISGSGSGGGYSPGGGPPPGPTMFRPDFTEEEPYRNPDMGPLGVVLSNGEFQLAVTDLEIPGRGFPFRLERTYRSKRDGAGSLLGMGWHLSYDEYLRAGIWVDEYGEGHSAIQWTMGNGWRDLWVNVDGSGYQPFGGFFGKIRSLGAGGFQIRYADGTVKTFGLATIRPPEEGLVWVLTRMEDRNGNALSIRFRPSAGSTAQRIDTITDTMGRNVSFAYDAADRLVAVTDFAGRRIDYGYDEFDHLVSVKAPAVTGTPNGNDFCDAGCPVPRKTTLYRYAAGDGCTEPNLLHNLTAVVSPRGEQFLTNRYAAAADPRCGEISASASTLDFVKEQRYGDGTVRYGYRFLNPSDSGLETAVLETTVTDRNGNEQVHEFNRQGNPLRVVTRTNRGIRTFEGSDEGDYVVTYHYVENGGGMISWRTESGGLNVDAEGRVVPYDEGTTIQNVYDQQNPDIFQRGNLVSVTRTPDAGRGAAQESLVTSFTYEPLFNQPSSVADPRNHRTSITYDYQEGSFASLTAGSPPPASVDPAWWKQDEIRSFLENGGGNLGDQNGDGYHRSGNAVRVSQGSITHAGGSRSEEIVTTLAYNGFGLPTTRRDAEFNESRFLYFAENDPDGNGTLSPSPADGRVLSAAAGSGGGGYLQRQIQDATPAMPLPSPPPLQGRESGQNPPPQNVVSTFAYDPAGNLRSLTDGRGVRTDYVVNALNQVVETVRAAASADPGSPPFGIREQFRYDAANNLVQRRQERRDDASAAPVDRWITTDMTYDGLDRKLTETLSTDDVPALRLTTAFAYDGNGNLRKTIFPAGNVLLRFYDERDLLFREVALKSPSPDPADMSFDPAADSVTRFDYQGSGKVIRRIDPEGHATLLGYDGYNRQIVSFDAAFQRTALAYDAGGNLVSRVVTGSLGGATPAPSGPPAAPFPEISSQRFFHDELGHLRRTDTKFFRYEGEAQIFLTTDANAGLTTTPDPSEEPAPAAGDGWTTRLARFDRLGRTAEETDDGGRRTETHYDGLGRVLRVSRNPVAPFVYVPGGTDERNAIQYAYDADGNVVEILETEWGSDRSDPARPNRKLPSQKHRTTFRFDALNRLVETTVVGRVGAAPLNLTTAMAYDSRGNKIQLTDPAGGRTKSFYDGLGRLRRTEAGYLWNGAAESVPAGLMNPANPDGKITTRFDYDANGRMIAMTDDNGRLTAFAYDGLNRRTGVTYPDGSSRNLGYDRDSLPALWDQLGPGAARLAVTTRYDALHRPIQKDVDNSGAPTFLGTRRQRFEYDGAGRATRAVDDTDLADGAPDSEVILAYDSLGDVVTETQGYRDATGAALSQGAHTVRSVYNGAGFRTRLIYPGGRAVTFVPDELDRVSDLLDGYTGLTRYDYLGPVRLLNRLHPNGTKLTLLADAADTLASGYDDARRIVDFATRSAGGSPAALAEFAYAYDAAGNRRYERRVHEPMGTNWKGEAYEYDVLHRLTKRSEGILNAAGALQGSAGASQAFTLDGLGNWSSTKTNGTIFDNGVNTLNQYKMFAGPAGTAKLAYDIAGNLSGAVTGGNERQFAYDFSNRLVLHLDAGQNLTTYRYDALGRRISKTLNGSSVTRFVYDGDRIIEERDGGGSLVAAYLNGPGIDEVLSRRRWSGAQSADLFYHTNAVGSVTAVTSSSGQIVERYRYDSFGQVTFLTAAGTAIVSSAVYNNVLFTGRYYDTESRLYDFRARTYDPYLGRFLQRDPLGETASINLYAYASDNPINAVDPTGTKTFPGGWAGRQLQGIAQRLSGAGWSVQQKMQYRPGHYANHVNANFDSFAAAQAEEIWYADYEREQAEWADKRARVAAHDIRNQVAESLKRSGSNVEHPEGIDILIVGLNQSILDEFAGTRDDTDLDTQAMNFIKAGHVVIVVNADDLATSALGPNFSSNAIDFLADQVMSLTRGSSTVRINIEGFSRGTGASVDLTNELTGDRRVDGGRISDFLIDPFVGKGSANIVNTSVSTMLFYSANFSPVKMVAPLFGYGRWVTKGDKILSGSSYPATHGNMDSYSGGVLGIIDQAILGGP